LNKIINRSWTANDSAELYGVNDWGAGYFGVDQQGLLSVTTTNADTPVNAPLLNIVNDIKERGLDAPVLIRFEDLLDQQISRLNNAFRNALSQRAIRVTIAASFLLRLTSNVMLLKR